VRPGASNTPPYDTWGRAATNLNLALGVASNTATLPRIVTAASKAIASWCGYDFYTRTVTEYPVPLLGAIQLRSGALQSITSITVDGSALSASLYRIDSSARGRIVLDMVIGGGSRTIGAIEPVGAPAYNNGRVVVVAVCGYVTPGQNAVSAGTYPTVNLPEDIQQAAIEVGVGMYRRMGRDADIDSTSLGAGSLSYRDDKHAIPVTARQLLAPYRKRWS
jgi:hypothetical protein